MLDAKSGKQVYKVRVGGGGQTFSASPVAAGSRIYFLSEDGVTFVLDTGDVYKEVARNELGELALSSPAIAGNALYIRTQSSSTKFPTEG